MARKKQQKDIVVYASPADAESDTLKKEFENLSLKQQAALTAFVKHNGNVTAACEIARITRATWYEWKKTDPEFQKALLAVDEFFADQLEAACHDFAFQGDSTLLIFMLKAKRRALYDDAYARQERAFEKGLQPADGFVPVRAVLVRDEEPEAVKKSKKGK